MHETKILFQGSTREDVLYKVRSIQAMDRQRTESDTERLNSPIKAVGPEHALLFCDQITGTGIAHSEPITFHVVIDAFQTTTVRYV